jgi:hypothetical protein
MKYPILADLDKLREAIAAAGSQRRFCEQQGIPRSTVQEALKRADQPAPTIAERVNNEREREQDKATAKELHDLVSRRAQIEAIHDAIKSAGMQATLPPVVTLTRHIGADEEFPVLHIGDWHVGMNTDRRVGVGFAVTMQTAARQVQSLIQAVARCAELQGCWRRLTIIDTGDDVEGQHMRSSQHREAEPVAEQAVMVGMLKAQLIRSLLQVFDSVDFYSVPGNHSRISSKPGIAGLDEIDPINSWDWISTEYARGLLGQFNGSEIDLPERVRIFNYGSFIARTEVAGWPIVMEHGAQIKGGAYGGVPYYPVARAATNVRNLLAPSDMELDPDTKQYLQRVGDPYLFLLGHFHRPTLIPQSFGWVGMTGSFPPTTPFVASTQHQALRPTQNLYSLHPHKGLTVYRPLYLELPEWRGLDSVRPAAPRIEWEESA